MKFMHQAPDDTMRENAPKNIRLSSNVAPNLTVRGKVAHKGTQSVLDDQLIDHDATCEQEPSRQQTLHDEYERTNQANLYLQEFVYAISHDLRTPLRSITGFSQLLAEEYTEQLDDNGKDYIKRIVDCGCRIQQLIDCVTEFSSNLCQGA